MELAGERQQGISGLGRKGAKGGLAKRLVATFQCRSGGIGGGGEGNGVASYLVKGFLALVERPGAHDAIGQLAACFESLRQWREWAEIHTRTRLKHCMVSTIIRESQPHRETDSSRSARVL